MLFRFFLSLGILLSGSLAFAQSSKDNKDNIYNREVIAALDFLNEVPPEDRRFIVFFSLIGIPPDQTINLTVEIAQGNPPELVRETRTLSYREMTPTLLSFVVHSLSSGNVVAPPVKITDTLYYVDFRDYNWTAEAIEKVAVFDPYFRVPWVDEKTDAQLRIIGGNHIFRADWFIVHTTDAARQQDLDIKTIFYYELLYANTLNAQGKKSGIPKNDKEFQEIWAADIGKIEKLELATGRIVEKGKSIVSRHTRQLYRARTEIGYYWHTMDVKNQQAGRNYIENLVPSLRIKDVDAGEIITNNLLGLNVYLLVNGKGDRVEVADTTLVIDNTDDKDRRVRTPKSCIVCHSSGINPAYDSWSELLDKGLELRVYDKDDRDRIQEFYTAPNLDEDILDDQQIFIRAVKRVTGIDSEQLIYLYAKFIEWYDKKIDLKQAAFETGVTKEEFVEKVQNTAAGSLGGLTKDKPIERENWEELKTGYFAIAMLLLNHRENLVKIPEEQIEPVPEEAPAEQVVQPQGSTAPVNIEPPHDITWSTTWDKDGYKTLTIRWVNGQNPDIVSSLTSSLYYRLGEDNTYYKSDGSWNVEKLTHDFAPNANSAKIMYVRPGDRLSFGIKHVTKRGQSVFVKKWILVE